LRHRLLRQSRGFEGFGAVRVPLAPNDLAALDYPHLPDDPVRLRATVLPATSNGRPHQDRVTSVDQLLDLDVGILELALQPVHELPVSLRSVKDSRASGDRAAGGVSEIRGDVSKCPIHISSAVRLEGPP